MQAGVSPARQRRAQHRHELRSLTYVTLDDANGGVVRNLNHKGIAVQAVAAVRPGQQLRVRFDLRGPRLRVEARGEVCWALTTGECGIRFLDLAPRQTRLIDEWIFGNLLQGMPRQSDGGESMFVAHGSTPSTMPGRSLALVTGGSEEVEANGLIISPRPIEVIKLPLRGEIPVDMGIQAAHGDLSGISANRITELDWLSQPLSGRGLAWTVNTLAVLAALLVFALVFLSVTREAPQWPFAMTAGAMACVAALYWGFFKVFGGGSPGARLARLCELGVEEEDDARFR